MPEITPVLTHPTLGRIADISIAFDATFNVRVALRDLMEIAMNHHAPWSDIRLIVELNRDMVGRARLMQTRRWISRSTARLEKGISDDIIMRLAPEEGCLGVLESSHCGGQLPLLTTIGAQGGVSTQPSIPLTSIFRGPDPK